MSLKFTLLIKYCSSNKIEDNECDLVNEKLMKNFVANFEGQKSLVKRESY